MTTSARLLVGLCIAALGAACKPSDALLQLNITADQAYLNTRIALSVNEGSAHVFSGAALSPSEPFRVGLYVSGDLRGTVDVAATVNDGVTGACLGAGIATVFDVSPGKVMPPEALLVATATGPCQGVLDPGTGGVTGTGGDIGTGGAPGTGGVVATGGVLGSGGVAATGGVMGTGGVIATGGVVSSGGVIGPGGAIGSGGIVATGGVTSTGGVASSGGVTSTGGVSGTGGAGGCGNLVDDMEDGNGLICTGTGRSGHWFTYVDSAGTISPPPSDTVPATPALLSPARGSSLYGMRASGTYSGYAGIGCLLNNPVIGQVPKTYDALAANYSGVHFFAKSDAGLYFAIQTAATISTTYGGTCTLASCYGASYTLLPSQLSATVWQEFNIPFALLTSGVATFRASDIWNIAFQPYSKGTFNLWIDDVTFY